MNVYLMEYFQYKRCKHKVVYLLDRPNDYDIRIVDEDYFKLYDEDFKRSYTEVPVADVGFEADDIIDAVSDGLCVIILAVLSDDVKGKVLDRLFRAFELLEQEKATILLVEKQDNLSDMAMQIQDKMYFNNLNWSEKEYVKLLKLQYREVFRNRFIYHNKLLFSLFLLFGKFKIRIKKR